MGLQGLTFQSHIHYEEEVRPGEKWWWNLEEEKRREKLPKVTRQRFMRASTTKVSQDSGFQVESFKKLVHCVAELGSCNTRYNLFFRGQHNDYLDGKGQTKLYPSIFRPDRDKKTLHHKVSDARFKKLDTFIETLNKNDSNLGLRSPLSVHIEYWLSLVQHYEIYRTPLLDLTQSLRVAASFALLNKENGSPRENGYLYVFGMPHLHRCISFFADDRITIVKLQNVCPANALRPHFQEGYLVGRWPRTSFKEAEDNFAYWLIGKYLLVNRGDFFGSEFPPIPVEALMPKKDEFRDKLMKLFPAMV